MRGTPDGAVTAESAHRENVGHQPDVAPSPRPEYRMSEARFPTLHQLTYSTDPDIEEWAHAYCDDKEEYFAELLGRVRDTVSPDDRVLEIGSVPCQFTLLLDCAGIDVTGIDVDPERVAPVIDRYDLDVRRCDVERDELPVESDSVDVVLATELLEHLRIDPLHALREFRRVLRPDGVLYLVTPNQYEIGSIWQFLRGRGAISHAHYEFSKLERLGHMGHVREYAPADVRELLREKGFRIEHHEFSNFAERTAPHRPVLGRVAELVQEAVPWTRRLQIVAAKPDATDA